MTLVPLFDLKFLNELAAGWCRNFKSAALGSHGHPQKRVGQAGINGRRGESWTRPLAAIRMQAPATHRKKEAIMDKIALAPAVLAVILALDVAPAHAINTKSYVSSFGSNANTCATPANACATFSHALSQTVAGG